MNNDLPQAYPEDLITKKKCVFSPAGVSFALIILILIILSYWSWFKSIRNKTERERCRDYMIKGQVRTVGTAIDVFLHDCKTHPDSIDDLITNPGISNWNGPYLESFPLDAWENQLTFRYIESSEYPELRSSGPDKTLNTVDDMVFFGGSKLSHEIWLTKNNIRFIIDALKKHHDKHNSWPSTTIGLKELGEGYALSDEWQIPLRLITTESNAVVQSAGPDKVIDTKDDLIDSIVITNKHEQD